LRIISGQLKGTILHPPKGLPVRPTTDRAKESLFNILENHFDFDGLEILDLFTGTGNISFESCSRGASKVVAVDIYFKCCEYIKSVKKQFDIKALEVRKADAYKYLEKETATYDIIFADAPYAQKEIRQIPSIVFEKKLLNKEGWLIMEHETNLDFNEQSGFFDKRIYGQSSFSFFRNP